MLSPLRDLFAAVFFLAIGLSVHPVDLLPALPAAFGLAAVTIATKVIPGWYAAARDQVSRRGRLRAGTALIARGEFSLVIVGLVGTLHDRLGPLVTAYVFILAIVGPLLTRMAGTVPLRPRPAAGAPDGGAGLIRQAGRTRPPPPSWSARNAARASLLMPARPCRRPPAPATLPSARTPTPSATGPRPFCGLP
ncbi:cation:proton antiporter [Streptomyces syringium]|uniref:cation:proton antiporter n=1 Tax=Streptomyces syringium TaxID=76729 RepID=UPI003AB098DE